MGQSISKKEDAVERVRQFQLDEDLAYATHLQLLELKDTPDSFESAYIGSSSSSNASSSTAHNQGGKGVWEGNEHRPPMEEKCKICLEEKQSAEIFNNTVCSHNFCCSCIIYHVRSKLQEKLVPIDCPEFNCTKHLTPQQCRLILPKQTLEEWCLALVEACIPKAEKFYCPFQDCSALLWKDVPASNEVPAITESECPECRRLFCAQCHVPWHAGFDCSKWQSSDKEKKHDNMLFKLAKRKGWKRCTNCRHIIEKISGCHHMICRCGYRFCYKCGSELMGPNNQCKCRGR